MMINFEKWDSQADRLAESFRNANPFEMVVMDDFCDPVRLGQLVDQIPDPVAAHINKSRDYMFARNKYEKSSFRDISPLFEELYADLVSDRFQQLLCKITGEQVFVDPAFHGGGIHQGGTGSYLDMHADFNFHPLKPDWFRNLNVLLYLNRDWRPEYKGQLKLRHKEHPERLAEVEPLFNRCVVMFTRDYTLHGYDPISFPEGQYRRSIAAYAYTLVEDKATIGKDRTTVWYPEQGGAAKKTVGRYWPTLVRIKNALFGSATARNK